LVILFFIRSNCSSKQQCASYSGHDNQQ